MDFSAHTSPTILIVEDEISYQRVLSEKLIRDGFSILQSSDGEEGLSIALEKKPSLVILDLLMPRVGGFSFLRSLRNSGEWGKHVPVIILTNLSSADDARNKDIAALEPAYYFEKTNISIADVLIKVRTCLSQNGSF
jgi:DNA-binding response OmpR family regulator